MVLTSVLFSIDMDKLCGVKKEERGRIQATMEEVRQSLYDNFPRSNLRGQPPTQAHLHVLVVNRQCEGRCGHELWVTKPEGVAADTLGCKRCISVVRL